MQNLKTRSKEEIIAEGELHTLSAEHLHDAVTTGELTPDDLIAHARQRHQAFENLGMMVAFAPSNSSDNGPLTGIPLTIKDTFDYIADGANRPKQYQGRRNPGPAPSIGFRANQNAHMVDHLLNQGALALGTTESSNLALDTQVHDMAHPLDPQMAVRGSTGGGSISPHIFGGMGLGSDAAGSLRAPAVYNAGGASLVLPYSRQLLEGHRPPVFKDRSTDGHLNFGRVGFCARDINDLLFVAQQLGFVDQKAHLKNRVLLLSDFAGLNLPNANEQALESMINALEAQNYQIDEKEILSDLVDDGNELIQLIGATLGCRIARSIHQGPFGEDLNNSSLMTKLAAKIWPLFGKLIVRNFEKYYLKQQKKYGQATPDWFLEGVLEGFQNPSKMLQTTDDFRAKLTNLFESLSSDYDAIIAPLDHAGQFSSRPTGTPINGMGYFTATAALPALVNMVPHAPAAAITTGQFASPDSESNLPNGVQIIGLGTQNSVATVLSLIQDLK